MNPKPILDPTKPNIDNLLTAAHAKNYDGQLDDIRWYADKVATEPVKTEKPVKHKWLHWWGLGK